MPELVIGKTRIPYEIRHSDKVTRKRIIITPDLVEVIAPSKARDADISVFVQKKRRWIFDKKEEMRERIARFEQDTYVRLRSGSKILYKGRNMRLRVVRANVNKVSINYQNGFKVTIPKRIGESQVEEYVSFELTFWLKNRLKEEARHTTRRYCEALKVKYRGIKINSSPKLWASCTKRGIIALNWQLIAVPKPVLEYVILHEVCHIKYRNHSKEFWNLLATKMADFSVRKKWLENANPTYAL